MPEWGYWARNMKFGIYRAIDEVLSPGRIVERTIHRWEPWDERIGASLEASSWFTDPIIRAGPEVAILGTSGDWHRFRNPKAAEGSKTYLLQEVIVDPLSAVPWTRSGWILGEVSPFGTDPRWNSIHERWRRPAVKKVDSLGTVVPATKNYYHFLIEILPRTLATLQAYPDTELWLLEDEAAPWQLKFLEELGISWKPLKDPAPIFFDSYSVTGRRYLDFRNEDFALLAEIIKVPVGSPGESTGTGIENVRLYIPRRGGSRVPAWERDLIRYLDRQGWLIYEPHRDSLALQAATFNSADVVVAPTGAALANLIWTKPKALAVGLFLPNLQQGIVWDNLTEVSGTALGIVPDFHLSRLDSTLECIDSALHSLKGE